MLDLLKMLIILDRTQLTWELMINRILIWNYLVTAGYILFKAF